MYREQQQRQLTVDGHISFAFIGVSVARSQRGACGLNIVSMPGRRSAILGVELAEVVRVTAPGCRM
jgi:hypothetical protein